VRRDAARLQRATNAVCYYGYGGRSKVRAQPITPSSCQTHRRAGTTGCDDGQHRADQVFIPF
jgi:hypothetical protein